VRGLRSVLVLADAVLIASVGAFAAWHRSPPEPAAAAAPAAVATRSPVTASAKRAQAHEAARALKRLESDPQALVAGGSRRALRGGARTAVPAGAKVTPVERSWSPDGVGGGVMTVKVAAPGHAPVSYAAVMIRERDGWKVLATVPLTGKHP
jgi:hypothetical protein